MHQPWLDAEWLTEQDILDRKGKFEPRGWPMRPSPEKLSTENDTVQPQASINTPPMLRPSIQLLYLMELPVMRELLICHPMEGMLVEIWKPVEI